MHALRNLHAVLAHIVQEVVVKILDARSLELRGKEALEVVFLAHEHEGHLVGYLGALARVALHQAPLDRRFGRSVVVEPGGVEVREPALEKAVGELLELHRIHLVKRAVYYREPHEAKAELLHGSVLSARALFCRPYLQVLEPLGAGVDVAFPKVRHSALLC